MKVSMIYWPDDEALKLCLRAIWITSGKNDVPQKPISSGLLSKVLDARHSPIRVLNFAFLFEGIPSNTATHFARHVHAVPFVQSLRNDRQTQLDGDHAPRNTPVNMILYCNAEELMIIANKRLCGRASPMTQLATHMMCGAVLEKFPEFSDLLVPMCLYHGGVCHEIKSCGYAERAQGEVKRDATD